MNKDINNIENNELYNLINSIISFTNSYINFDNSTILIEESFQVIINLKIVNSCAFIKMDKETFDFSIHSSYPKNTFEYFESVLQNLSESREIGITFKSGNFYITNDKESNEYFLLIPMVCSGHIIGIYIIESEYNFEDISIQLLNILVLFVKSLSLAFENKELHSEIVNSSNLLDQLIASKTIELVENNQQLSEKIEVLKTNLSMSIPHEVRTPINEIIGMNSYLKSFFNNYNGIPEEDKNDILEIINDISTSSNRLKSLFENFIYHTRLSLISTSITEIEQLQNKYCPYCDSVIYEQAILKAQNYNRKADIKINLVSASVKMGEEYLAKLIDELVDNALKYSPKGKEVYIYSSIQQDYYFLTIHDQGLGIPQKYMNHIDSYIQFDRQSNEQQGLGLGLGIIFKIVDLHNGYIEIESEQNKFTKIMIKIPIAKNLVL